MTTDDINGTLETEVEAVGGQDPSVLGTASDSDESESLLASISVMPYPTPATWICCWTWA